MGRDLIMGPFTSFYLLKNLARNGSVFWIYLKAKSQEGCHKSLIVIWSTGTGHTPKQMTSLEWREREGYSTPHCFPRHPWTHGREGSRRKETLCFGVTEAAQLYSLELRSLSITGLLHNLTKGSIPEYFQGLKEKHSWNWRLGMSSIARKSPKLPKTAFFFSRSQVVTFCPTCSVRSLFAHQCHVILYHFCFPTIHTMFCFHSYCPFNSAQFGPTLDSLSIGGYWPVRKTKSCLAFLNLFFELLHTVQESHHCMIKLVVPEKPQPPRTV